MGSFQCKACGRRLAAFVNRCPTCSSFGTLEASSEAPELKTTRVRKVTPLPVRGFSHINPHLIERYGSIRAAAASFPSIAVPPKKKIELLSDIVAEVRDRFLTGNVVLDRGAFGDGRNPGIAHRSSSLLAGMPGTYKSTMGLEALAGVAELHEVAVTWIVSEMAPKFVREYAQKFGLFKRYPKAKELLYIVGVESSRQALEAIDDSPGVLYGLDSVSHLASLERMPLEVLVQKFTNRCEDSPKKPDRTGIHIAHGTKDGDMSGPLKAQHAADAVFLLEFYDPVTGETLPPGHKLDVMRMTAPKNRFSFATRGICGRFQLVEDLGPVPLPLDA